jgi:hypothetical protein
VGRKFDFLGFEPIYTSLGEAGSAKDEWYDSDLFSDLSSHFPGLAREIGNSRAVIRTSMPIYVKSRWNLIGRLDDLMRPLLDNLAKMLYENSDNKKAGIITGEDMERGKNYTRVGIMVALMKLFFYPTEQWPNLLEAANKIDGLMEIVEDTLEKVQIREISDSITNIQEQVVDSLGSLRNHLNNEAISGKTLPGKCHYLGKSS